MSLIVEGSQADLLRRDLAAALRRPAFWLAAMRELVPVAGVFLFGWMAFQAALFFLLECWLFMTVRATAGVLFDPKGRNWHLPPAGFVRYWKLTVYYLMGGLTFAFPVGVMGLLILVAVFPDEDWDAFYLGGYAEPAFLAGLAVLFASEIFAGWRLHRRLAGGGEERPDERRRVRAMFNRCLAVFACIALVGQFSGPGIGGRFFVAVAALVALFFEATQDGGARAAAGPPNALGRTAR